jgi:hypothetical protein
MTRYWTLTISVVLQSEQINREHLYPASIWFSSVVLWGVELNIYGWTKPKFVDRRNFWSYRWLTLQRNPYRRAGGNRSGDGWTEAFSAKNFITSLSDRFRKSKMPSSMSGEMRATQTNAWAGGRTLSVINSTQEEGNADYCLGKWRPSYVRQIDTYIDLARALNLAEDGP